LVVAALAPVLVFSVVMVVLFSRQERAAAEQGMRETARALFACWPTACAS
jgi:hypothetical protein